MGRLAADAAEVRIIPRRKGHGTVGWAQRSRASPMARVKATYTWNSKWYRIGSYYLPIVEIVNPNNPRVLRWWYTWDKGQNMGIYKSNKLGVDFRSKQRGYQLISQQEMGIGISDRMFKEFKVTKWLRIVPILCPAMLSLSLFRICFWSHPGRTCGSYLRDPLWSTDYFQPPKHYYFHGENDMCFAGWWFQPLWRIWVRQLGWLCPIYGKIRHVPNHQTVCKWGCPYVTTFVTSKSMVFLGLRKVQFWLPKALDCLIQIGALMMGFQHWPNIDHRAWAYWPCCNQNAWIMWNPPLTFSILPPGALFPGLT